MRVFWVLGYDIYYPCGDNWVASFASYDEAETYIAAVRCGDDNDGQIFDRYRIIDISERL